MKILKTKARTESFLSSVPPPSIRCVVFMVPNHDLPDIQCFSRLHRSLRPNPIRAPLTSYIDCASPLIDTHVDSLIARYPSSRPPTLSSSSECRSLLSLSSSVTPYTLSFASPFFQGRHRAGLCHSLHHSQQHGEGGGKPAARRFAQARY